MRRGLVVVMGFVGTFTGPALVGLALMRVAVRVRERRRYRGVAFPLPVVGVRKHQLEVRNPHDQSQAAAQCRPEVAIQGFHAPHDR